jgi:hypothetical protein
MAEQVDRRAPVLVVGLPRSGTTWTARVLGAGPGARVVMEPDNEKTSAPAISAKRGLGRYPVLAPGDQARAYRRLWTWALGGAPRSTALRLADRVLREADDSELEASVSGRMPARLRVSGALARLGLSHVTSESSPDRTVAKSVHACLAVEWIANELSSDVVVVRRHPANVLASWIELDLPDSDRGLEQHPAVQSRFVKPWGLSAPGPTALERAAWQIGLMSCVLEDACARNPRWHVRSHEALCGEPAQEFGRLYRDTGLEWSAHVEEVLSAGERPGSGFSLHRRSSELAESWRTRLGESEVSVLRRVLAGFPLVDPWAQEHPIGTQEDEEFAETEAGTPGPPDQAPARS